MILDTPFIAFGKEYKLALDTKKLDRNYDDEDYAYWIVETNGKIFEINIWKLNGHFTTSGKVYAFASVGAFEDDDADEELEIKFS